MGKITEINCTVRFDLKFNFREKINKLNISIFGNFYLVKDHKNRKELINYPSFEFW